MVKVSINLKSLSHIFYNTGNPLYLVGGYIRNYLLNISTYDVDIAGALPAKEVIALCKKNGFKAEVINKKLGTVLISKKDEKYEYTTFRKEIYDKTGKHRPEEVEFVSSPAEDAIRRDFTVNAMYYDIYEEKLYDFFNSYKDLNNRVLKTVTKPEVVFNDDGLRILRLIRFICELGFKPERQTLKVAKALSYKVGDISKERILREIKTTINGGLKYLLKNQTHGNAVKYYNSLNLWAYMFNQSFKDFKVKRSGRFYKAFLKSDGQNRYVAFMCLVLSNYVNLQTNDNNIFYSVQQLLGQGGLRDSNKNTEDVYQAFIFAKKLLTFNDIEITDNKLCLHFEKLGFEVKNYLALIHTDKVNKIRLRLMQLKKAKVPFSVEDLKITTSDLVEKVRVKDVHISQVKTALFEACVDGLFMNDRDILLEQANYFYDNYLKKLFSESRKGLQVEEEVIYTDAMKTGTDDNNLIEADAEFNTPEVDEMVLETASMINLETALKSNTKTADADIENKIKEKGGKVVNGKQSGVRRSIKDSNLDRSSIDGNIPVLTESGTTQPLAEIEQTELNVKVGAAKKTSSIKKDVPNVKTTELNEKKASLNNNKKPVSSTNGDVQNKTTSKNKTVAKGVSNSNSKSAKTKSLESSTAKIDSKKPTSDVANKKTDTKKAANDVGNKKTATKKTTANTKKAGNDIAKTTAKDIKSTDNKTATDSKAKVSSKTTKDLDNKKTGVKSETTKDLDSGTKASTKKTTNDIEKTTANDIKSTDNKITKVGGKAKVSAKKNYK